MNSHVEAILYFWFGEKIEDEAMLGAFRKLWFGGDPLFDVQMRERFAADVRSARAHKLDHWQAAPLGRLALILLLDQFPRNIYRRTPKAFASDAQAQQLCLEGMERGDLDSLDLFQKVFFCMPLMHAESLPLQERSVACFTAIAREAPSHFAPFLEETVAFAREHRDLIARFGRFPHRNEILERASTPEERAYLEDEGSRFGQ